MTDTNKTELIVIIDRSGSMASIKDDMVGGFKTFIDEQRAAPGQLFVSLYRFDNEYEVVYEEKPAAEVGALELQPRGGTALLDAVGRTVVSVGERLAKKPEHERPGAIIVLVITDGAENASREFTAQTVKKLIQTQEKEYQWKFVYLGSSLAGLAEAKTYGFIRQTAFHEECVGDMYAGTSASVLSYRGDVARGVKDSELRVNSTAGKTKQ